MNNTTLKKSNEIENSKIFKSSTFSSTKLNLQIFKSSLLTLSSTGEGACQDFSAVGRKQQFTQSNSANSAVGKLSIIHCQPSARRSQLSIVHYPLLILLCLLFSVNAWAQGQYFGGGAGTSSDPYQISTVTHLNNMADHIADYDGWNNKYFIVMADISGVTKIIGHESTRFMGHFDGDGHTIDLSINVTNGNAYGDGAGGGLFGQVSGAEIKNVIVTGSVVYNLNQVAGIVGQANEGSRIENCMNYATPRVTGSVGAIGGIVGLLSCSTIKDCKNYANIDGLNKDNIGGIVAQTSSTYSVNTDGNCIVDGCENYGTISNGNKNVGGIIGQAMLYNSHTLSVTNCKNHDVVVISGNEYVGGIVGCTEVYNNHAGSFTYDGCCNDGSVTGARYVGGIAGYIDIDGTLNSYILGCNNNSSAEIKATGIGYVGGIVGSIQTNTTTGYVFVNKCMNAGEVSGTYTTGSTSTSRVGGLIGYCGKPTKVYNSYNTANVSCTGNSASDYLYMGGLIGELSQNSTVNNCYNVGDVISNGNSGSYIGGIVGYCNGKMSNSYNGGTVSNSNYYTGGIAGYRLSNSEVWHCYTRNNCGTRDGINASGNIATGAYLYMFRPFSHTSYNDNKLLSDVTVNGTTYETSVNFYEILNAWVDSANNGGDTYYTWVDASSNDDNKGMPKFFTCTPVPDPSLSVTQTNTGGRELQVSWTATTGVSYTLYYGVNDPNSGLENVYNAGAQTSPYNALRLTNGVEYHFAIKPTGTGDYCADNPLSSTVSATPECNE